MKRREFLRKLGLNIAALAMIKSTEDKETPEIEVLRLDQSDPESEFIYFAGPEIDSETQIPLFTLE